MLNHQCSAVQQTDTHGLIAASAKGSLRLRAEGGRCYWLLVERARGVYGQAYLGVLRQGDLSSSLSYQ
jgi:hypothetical protein